LVSPLRALIQPFVQGLSELAPLTVQVGQRLDLEQFTKQLSAYAYNRTDLVERRGEFAVRGGILDVFPPTEDHPLRLDLWGDTVEEIKRFTVADQRSGGDAPDGLWAPACRELLLTEAVQQRAGAMVGAFPGFAEMLSKVAQGMAVEGLESLIPLLVDDLTDLVEQLPDRSLVLLSEPELLVRRAHDLDAAANEFRQAAWSVAAAGGSAPIDFGGGYRQLDDLAERMEQRGLGPWTLSGLGQATIELSLAEPPLLANDPEKILAGLGQKAAAGWSCLLLAEGHGSAERLVEQLMGFGLPARVVDALPDQRVPGVILVACGQGPGFVSNQLKLLVLSQAELRGRAGRLRSRRTSMPSRRSRQTVDPLALRQGDLVVHQQHGIGRFVELVLRPGVSPLLRAGGSPAMREYIVLEYAPSRRGQAPDRLFVPTDSLDQVSRYVGSEAPALSHLGGSEWTKAKTRARKAVREIAGELIRLYSARQASRGFAYGPDTPWQRELEDAFEYVETPDQLQTIDEVKADMCKPIPMDRLICGDVGYGKTEIAVRAAFKAVQDGKQVAVLVPTTLLVQQHLETFSERYAAFPVVVKPLSRFQNAKQVNQTKQELAQGKVDVVIGTHALITAQVSFKDLGLVIIDEEQRFGVEHKETLKALRTDVDVLSMSATPIPRSLEMAISGIREMSTLATPPEERHPVLTYVGAWDERQVTAAIRRELLRDGQVFFVHNRTKSINALAAHLAELVPEARIAVAHGSMPEHQLEQVIVDFWDKAFDVLVCTTIIETGLDVANANTLIVDHAERLGLAQMHQLRGRVGRGRERAYAYFFHPAEPPLTQTAHERLTTIAAQAELGAGMAVAMKDLELRGAGNLLGAQQSGHIEGVGFDLYLRMIGEAVAEYRGEGGEVAEVVVELPVDGHIPVEYIEAERLRLEAYGKLASAHDSASLAAVREELADRYGPIPVPVDNLFGVAQLRLVARAANITEITAQGKFIRFAPVELPESARLRLARLHKGSVIKPAVRTVLVPLPRPPHIGAPPL
ncbi:MAG: transcription-repair coupling factor, partial [Bifidobacteriaceae bacterium]|nr:transcription-repair coupling factor [Bifidobacteriaceae bacterium]